MWLVDGGICVYDFEERCRPASSKPFRTAFGQSLTDHESDREGACGRVPATSHALEYRDGTMANGSTYPDTFSVRKRSLQGGVWCYAGVFS